VDPVRWQGKVVAALQEEPGARRRSGEVKREGERRGDGAGRAERRCRRGLDEDAKGQGTKMAPHVGVNAKIVERATGGALSVGQ